MLDCDTTKTKPRLKTQHQVTVVITNKVSLLKHEIISVNISKTKTDLFTAF